jgi:ribosome maturation factor RimP
MGAHGEWVTHIEAALAGLGYELIDFEIHAPPTGILKCTIDGFWEEGSDKRPVIGIEDCAQCSRAVTEFLEDRGLDEVYGVEVYSPGIFRELRRTKDFIRFQGARVGIKLHTQLDETERGGFQAEKTSLREQKMQQKRLKQKDFLGLLERFAGPVQTTETLKSDLGSLWIQLWQEDAVVRIPLSKLQKIWLEPDLKAKK